MSLKTTCALCRGQFLEGFRVKIATSAWGLVPLYYHPECYEGLWCTFEEVTNG